MKTWFERAKEEIKRKGITQEFLAEALGIAQPTVSAKLAGRRDASSEEVAAFARAIGVSPSWLAYGEKQDQLLALPEPTVRATPGEIADVIDGAMRLAGLDLSALGGRAVVVAKIQLALEMQRVGLEKPELTFTDLTKPDPEIPSMFSIADDDQKKAS